MLISGTMNGRVEAERLEIVAGGSVEGTISVIDLVIEPGGRFNGASELRQQPASDAAKAANRRAAAERDDDAGKESSPA